MNPSQALLLSYRRALKKLEDDSGFPSPDWIWRDGEPNPIENFSKNGMEGAFVQFAFSEPFEGVIGFVLMVCSDGLMTARATRECEATEITKAHLLDSYIPRRTREEGKGWVANYL